MDTLQYNYFIHYPYMGNSCNCHSIVEQGKDC